MSRLILLVGKSGSGKTTIANYLEEYYGWNQLQSYTTRSPRYENEKGHTFISMQEYMHLPNKVATTYFNGQYYCATQEQCEQSDVYVIDPHGIESFMRNYHGDKKYLIVYLDVNPLTRFFRMLKRGDKIYAAIDRLLHDHQSFKGFKKRPDIVIVKKMNVATVSGLIWKLWRM